MPLPNNRAFWLLAAAVAQIARFFRWVKKHFSVD